MPERHRLTPSTHSLSGTLKRTFQQADSSHFSESRLRPVRPIKSHSSPQIEGQMSGVKLSVRWNRVAVGCGGCSRRLPATECLFSVQSRHNHTSSIPTYWTFEEDAHRNADPNLGLQPSLSLKSSLSNPRLQIAICFNRKQEMLLASLVLTLLV